MRTPRTVTRRALVVALLTTSACPLPPPPADEPSPEPEGSGAATYVKSYAIAERHLEPRATASAMSGATYQVGVRTREDGAQGTATLVTTRVDQNGDVSWARGYLGENLQSSLREIVGAVESFGMTAGGARDPQGAPPRVWVAGHASDGAVVLELGADGRVLSRRTYGTSIKLAAIAARPDGGFVIAGNTEVVNATGVLPAGDLWLHAADHNGAGLWTHTSFDPTDAEIVTRLRVDRSGTVFISGQRVTSGADPREFDGVASFWSATADAQGVVAREETGFEDDGAAMSVVSFPAFPLSTSGRAGRAVVGFGMDDGPPRGRLVLLEEGDDGLELVQDTGIDLGGIGGTIVDVETRDTISDGKLDLHFLVTSAKRIVEHPEVDGSMRRREESMVKFLVRDGDEYDAATGGIWAEDLGVPLHDFVRLDRIAMTPQDLDGFRVLAREGDIVGGPRGEATMIRLALNDLAVQSRKVVRATDFARASDGGAVIWTRERVARLDASDDELWSVELTSPLGRGPVGVAAIRGRNGVDRGALVCAPAGDTASLVLSYDELGALRFAREIPDVTLLGLAPLAQGAAAAAIGVARTGDASHLITFDIDATILSARSLPAGVEALGPPIAGGDRILVPTNRGVLWLAAATGDPSDLWWSGQGFFGVALHPTPDGGLWQVVGGKFAYRFDREGRVQAARELVLERGAPLTERLDQPLLGARADGGLLIASTVIARDVDGQRCADARDCADLLVASLDARGELSWNRVYGAARREATSAAAPNRPRPIGTADNGVLLTATTTSYVYPQSSTLGLRLDADGRAAASCVAQRETAMRLTSRPLESGPSNAPRADPFALAAGAFRTTTRPTTSETIAVVVARSCGDVSRAPVLTTKVDGSGSIVSTPSGMTCPSDCTQSWPTGAIITLEARPAEGFHLASWADGCAGTRPVVDVTLAADTTCTARFARGAGPAACSGDGDCAADPRDDGDACNGRLVCRDGACVDDGGTVTCPTSEQACERNACDPETGACVAEPMDGATCDDGDACTGPDRCQGAACVGGPDTCGCATTDDCGDEEDGDACNGKLMCDGSGRCVLDPTTIITCATTDDTDCLKARCAPATGLCALEPVAGACDDGNPCDGPDVCDAGNCKQGPARVCPDDDQNPCTDHECAPADGLCHSIANTASCEDGDLCTLADRCAEGACVGGEARVCDDGDVCTDDVCVPATGACTGVFNTAECDDGLRCTSGDACAAGTCVGTPRACDDGDACTLDACDPGSGECTFDPAPALAACDDQNPCTADGCAPATGDCTHDTAAADAACAAVTCGSICDPAGGCAQVTECSPPTNLVAIASGNRVLLTWDAAAGASGYILYIGFTPGVSPATGGALLGAESGEEIVGLAPGRPAYFIVTALHAGGESGPSNEATATPTADDVVPPFLACMSPTAGSIGIDPARPIVLSFSEPLAAATLAGGITVTGPGPGDVVAGTITSAGAEVTFTPSAALAHATTYTVSVATTLTDLAGNTLASAETRTFTTRPAAPSGLTVLGHEGHHTLEWAPVPGARGYTIHRGDLPAGPMTPLGGTRRPSATLALGAGRYTITALTSAGESGPSATIATPAQTPTVQPATSARALPGNTEALLTWDPAAPDYLFLTGVAASDTLTNGVPHGLVVGQRVTLSDIVGGDGAVPGTYAVSAVPSATTFRLSGFTFTSDITSAYGVTAITYDVLRATTASGALAPVATGLVGRAYRDSGLTNDTTYRYVVHARSGTVAGPWSVEASVTPRDDRPRAPTGVVATLERDWVELAWEPVAGAVGYVIYAGSPMVAPVRVGAFTTASARVDPSLYLGAADVVFSVVAVNSAGMHGAPSLPVSLGAATGALPRATSLLVAVPTLPETVLLHWAPVMEATAYLLEAAPTPGGPFEEVAAVFGTSTTDVIAGGGARSYRVRATSDNGALVSAPSNVLTVTALGDGGAPTAPANVVVYPGDQCVSVRWNVVPGAAWYTVSRRIGAGAFEQVSGGTEGYANLVTDCGRDNDTTVTYVVDAVRDGEIASSAPVTATPSATRPAAPAIQAIPGDGRVHVVWADQATAGTSFRVWRRRVGTGAWAELAQTSASSYVDAAVVNDLDYEYAVQTESAAGRGAVGLGVTARPRSSLRAPTNVVATAGDGCVQVAWDFEPSAHWYVTMVASAPGGPWAVADGGTTQWRNQASACGLTNGAPTYVVVYAVSAAGSSGYSDEAVATPLEALPVAPESVGVSPNFEGARVIWSAVADAERYHVWRHAEGSPWAEVGVTTATSFYDASADNETAYIYAVQPANAAGRGSMLVTSGATPQATYPEVPTGLSLQPGNGCVTLSWDMVAGSRWYWPARGADPRGPFDGLGSGTNLGVETHWTHCEAPGDPMPAWVSVQGQDLLAGTRSEYAEALATSTSSALPSAPACAAIGGSEQVSLTWEPTDGATRYHVHRRTATTPWAEVGVTETNGYFDGCLEDGTTYTYSLQAEGASGRGAISTFECAVTPSAAQLAVPSAISAHPGRGCVTLTWAPVSGASWYNVFHAPARGGPYQSIGGTNDGTDTAWTHCALTDEEEAWFVVQTVAGAGAETSGLSAEVTATPSAALPDRPEWTQATRGAAGVLAVSWPPIDGALGYRVWRRSAAAPWALVAQTTGATYEDTGLTSGTSYAYAIQAFSPVGAGALGVASGLVAAP